MSSKGMSPQLISKIEQVINYDIKITSLLTEVAEDTRDPTLQTLITSIIGDSNNHIRFFTLLLSQAATIPVKIKVSSKYSVNLKQNNLSKKEGFFMYQRRPDPTHPHPCPPCPCPQCDNYRQMLEESMQDEICDAGFYAEIANEAPTDILREITTSIVGDEYGHARLQAALLGICPPSASCPPACPPATGNFEEDVRTAINGELGAIRRYAELAGCAPTLEIRYLLTSILGDEYAHARIWNAMLLGNSICESPCK